MATPVATIVIPTKNRREDVVRAVESSLGQSVPVEVIVCDDASTDGTSEALRERFPEVIVLRSEKSIGSTINRNRAVERAGTNFIFSLDDDSAFIHTRTVEQTLRDFDHPRVGAVAVPFANVRFTPEVHQRAPEGGGVYVIGSYRGCAAAWRRDVFRYLGGYSAVLGHYVEEPELCVRMLGSGFFVRLGRAEHMEHYESPKRDSSHIAYLNGRNQALLVYMNTPMPQVLWMLPGTCLQNLRARRMQGSRGKVARGIVDGLRTAFGGRAGRNPIDPRGWRAVRRLRGRPCTPLAEIEGLLPPLPRELPARMEGRLGDRELAGGAWSKH